MNHIKSLILLDLRRLFSLRVIFPLYLVVMLVFAAVGRGGGAMLSSFGFIIFIYLWVYGPSGYGSDILLGILPATRSQIVLARYLYSLGGVVFGSGSIGIIQAVTGGGKAVFPVMLLFCSGCVFTAVVTPPLLYFGAAKSRYFVLAVYVIGIAAPGASSSIINSGGVRIDFEAGAALAAVSLALLAVSCIISLKLFARREFDA